MIRAAFAVLLLAVAPAAAAVSGDPINLQTIRQRLAELGPTATVRELDGAGRWEQVTSRIGSGDARWIALAPELAKGADAGTAETLSISLADALPKSPRAVLAVLDLKRRSNLSPERVCRAPLAQDTAERQTAYRTSALLAVASVADARLDRARDACASRLQSL